MTQKTLQPRREKSAGIAVTALLFDEDTTRAAINLGAVDVRTEEQAAQLFSKVRRKVLGQSRAALAGDATFRTWDWSVAQNQVRRLLPGIAKFDGMRQQDRVDLFDALNEGLVLDGQVTLQVTKHGLAFRLQSDSILGAASRGLMPFLVPNGWPANRLGQCRAKGCGRYFLRPDGQRGRKAVFCSPGHATKTHVREHRERQEAR